MGEENSIVTKAPTEARMAIMKLLPRFRRAYDELEPLAFRERWFRSDIEAFQLERINAVWAHATEHVPWYREIRARLDSPSRFESLEEFRSVVHVLSKQDVREHPEAFLSDRAQPGGWHRTGGSTGAPMRNYWSTAGHREILRTRYRHLDLWGFDIFARTAYLWGHSASLAPGLSGWLERTRRPIEDRLRNRLRLSAYEVGQAALHGYLRQIAAFRPTIVYGYSSALYLLAQEAERTGFRCDSPRLFILTGEPALPVHVDTIERVFSVRTAVEYGAIETGVMASEWPDRTLRVREDVVMIETLPREDGRYEIVATVLVNPSFPLLRYAIGDVTDAPLDVPGRGFAVLKNVSGRDNEYIMTRTGRRLHSARFDALFKYQAGPGIRRFRVRQRSDGSLEVKLEVDDPQSRLSLDALEGRLRDLVDGWPASVEVVDRIPLTASGKHRIVVSDLSPPTGRETGGNGAANGRSPSNAKVAEAALGTPAPGRAARLREMLQRPELAFLMEAHNGLSARIAQEAGFEALWASGLSISAALGVRDSNEASWTQVLEVLEFMSDAVGIPILVDGDTGYGNFNNMRRLVQKLEQRGIAGVCVEDKLFPKTNSFIRGSAQPLAEVDEFCGRLRAGLDARRSADFVIVARVEALIAGWGLDEALRRAHAYADAGVDAILMHSAERSATEVLAFTDAWDRRLPVVLVPTKYYATPTDVFRKHGVSALIWANHMMRSCITAMQRTAREVFEDQSLINVEDRVAPLAEVFRLQGQPELAEAEKRYLPHGAARTRAIVLAVERGAELGELTARCPKAMVPIGGAPILQRVVETYRAAGIRSVAVVRGWHREAVDLPGLEYHDVPEDAGEIGALRAALVSLDGPCVVSPGHVLFKKYVPQELMDAEADFAIAVDSQARSGVPDHRRIEASQSSARAAYGESVTLSRVGPAVAAETVHGEWMGFLAVSARGASVLRAALAEPDLADGDGLDRLLARLVERGEDVRVVYIGGGWLDVDSLEDVAEGGSFR